MSNRMIADFTRDDWHSLKVRMVDYARSIGIDQIGVASAEPFDEMKQRLQVQQNKGFMSGFEEKDIDRRVHPERHLPAARTMIAIAVAYPSKLANPPVSSKGAYRGVIARSAWGQDYHRVLKQRLQSLAEWFADELADFRYESMVDTGALVDRAVAERAGIGWSAKNCAIISPIYGSWIYLGEMITNLPLPVDEPLLDQCGSCTLCIDACPTGALVGPGQLDATKCISFLTQTKTDVPDEVKLKIGNRLYGCDTCQVVCPKNKGKNWTQHAELAPNPELAKPLLKPILELSNREFRETFGESAAAWRGKTPIQRNAIYALGHFRDDSAIMLLGKLAETDHRPVIRSAAIWALSRIGTADAMQRIERCAQVEVDQAVQETIARVKTGTPFDTESG